MEIVSKNHRNHSSNSPAIGFVPRSYIQIDSRSSQSSIFSDQIHNGMVERIYLLTDM